LSQTAFCIIGIGLFPVLKRPERGAHHPPPSRVGLRMGWRRNAASPLCLAGTSCGDIEIYAWTSKANCNSGEHWTVWRHAERYEQSTDASCQIK